MLPGVEGDLVVTRSAGENHGHEMGHVVCMLGLCVFTVCRYAKKHERIRKEMDG